MEALIGLHFYEKNHMDMCLALAQLLAKEALRNVLLFCGVLTAIVSMYMVLARSANRCFELKAQPPAGSAQYPVISRYPTPSWLPLNFTGPSQ